MPEDVWEVEEETLAGLKDLERLARSASMYAGVMVGTVPKSSGLSAYSHTWSRPLKGLRQARHPSFALSNFFSSSVNFKACLRLAEEGWADEDEDEFE
ncbi:hypothetical protein H0H92_001878, partial [Tricholoma furcatifolium]